MENSKQFRKRAAILSCLRATAAHPSAEMVHQMLQAEHPDISLATIYRNLALFRQQGLVQCVGTVQGRERFDANTAPHVHFICTRCAAVLDLPKIPVPRLVADAARQDAVGSVSACQLTFTGLCRACCCAEEPA